MAVARKLSFIFFRYLLILFSSIGSLFIFYYLFTPLTFYPSAWILSIFYNLSISGNNLLFEGVRISIINACIAGSAYFFLLMLNLSTPMGIKKRVPSLIFSFALFLIINILRIVIFSILLLASFSYFELTHLIFWHIMSAVFVVLIWILTVRIFSIKEIPFYSDLVFLKSLTKEKSRKRK